MRGSVRTILAGLAVLALCLLLAVLSWQVLLGSIFLAATGWAAWTARKGSINRQGYEVRRTDNRERAGSKRRKALRRGNVYEFPSNSQRQERPPASAKRDSASS